MNIRPLSIISFKPTEGISQEAIIVYSDMVPVTCRAISVCLSVGKQGIRRGISVKVVVFSVIPPSVKFNSNTVGYAQITNTPSLAAHIIRNGLHNKNNAIRSYYSVNISLAAALA